MASVLHQFDGLTALRHALQSKKISATELAQDCLRQIQTQQPLNAFVHVDAGLTLDQARLADKKLAEGTGGPLTGIPIAHKDVFVTRGWRSTAGSNMLKNYVSPFDATVVDNLLQAGTVSLGKLNCDEFAMGSSNEHSAFGPTQNPWDSTAVPGGSSGASAAAVAARLVMASTGTDTGGSVRQPAALCGVSGIKPTYGTVSRYGMIAYGSSLDQAGPIARSAEDLVEVLDTMSGFDHRDSTSAEYCNGIANTQGRIRNDFAMHNQRFGLDATLPLKDLRIGVPKEYFGEGLSTDVANAIENALAQFEKLGAKRVEISLPRTRLSIPAYYVIAPAEASSNLSRYDGVRYGHRSESYTDLADMTGRSRAEGFGSEVQRRILIGTYVLSHGYYDAYYLQAQRLRRLIVDDFKSALGAQCDVIMGPVTPAVAKQIGTNTDDPTADWLADIYTLSLNLAGLPGMSIPCGFASGASGKQLPIGLQIIGNYFDEGRLLAVAHQYQQVTDWHQRNAGQA
ncbi:Asp-tRNA(Asn)/Glu-tRNA(Gln) amidotransferase subunit GatA [Orrella sp. NBD-18]|uniref:Glutamyl-tRNA(Gln) amidotransferase subunit A n=1 Tax=Sheuella amnicola TaxID=2707330 RepID=A0A6B2R1T5_9BURK|nr:Asp-tRNA(Asn)/Glu-tRNA(Gln) amidotransferase subunit GatA [Sheuella amnicola]NDY84202.1 Asp-tRNA(Asn)/Glu-tRNA(Gln) amidotransferase subunit GatA [Sheuella amnicola]